METLSAKFASTIRETRQWLEDCQELPSIPRAEEEELQSLLAFAKAEKSKAAEHQRRLQSLKFQASKVKPKISAPPSETTSEADELAELLSSLRQKLQDSCSVGTLTGLLEVLKDTSSLPEAQQKNLATIQEVARERLAQLSKEAEEAAAQHHAQEAELRELQKQKEELLGKVKEARWMAERAKNAQDGDSVTSRDTSAGAVEEHSNPSSRSNSDVGLRPEAPPERTGPEVEKAPERPACPAKGKGKGVAPKAPPKAKAKAKTHHSAVSNGFVTLHWHVIKEEEKLESKDVFLSRLEALKMAGDGDTLESLAPQPGIFSSSQEVEVPMSLMEHYWKKRDSFAPRRHSVDALGTIDSARQSLLDEKKLQMLGISLKRHEHRNQGVKGAEAIVSIKCAFLRCDFDVLHIECLSVIRTVIKQHENDGQPVTTFVTQNGEDSIHSLRCPIEHRLVYELCKEMGLSSSIFVPKTLAVLKKLNFLSTAMAFVEGNADRREVFVHTVFLEGVTILDGICPMAIGRLAMANKELQQLVMQEKRIWLNSIATALPAFELNPELLEKPHKFLPFLRDFRKAIAIPGPERRAKGTDTARSKQSRWTQCPKATHVLRLRRLEDARKLQDRLRIADQIAREQLANGGCYAKVFLAPLVLPEMHNKARFWLEDSDEEGLHSHLAFGQPIVVPADEAPQSDESDTGNRLRQIGDDQVRPCALRIHFVRLQHQLLMAARDDDAPAIMIPLNGPPYHEPRRPSPVGAMRVTVDISVADMKHQLFHVRGITLSVNGSKLRNRNRVLGWTVAVSTHPLRGSAALLPATLPLRGLL